MLSQEAQERHSAIRVVPNPELQVLRPKECFTVKRRHPLVTAAISAASLNKHLSDLRYLYLTST